MRDVGDHKTPAALRRAEREARRSAALKANMARRKAQARGRVLDDGQMPLHPVEDADGQTGEQE